MTHNERKSGVFHDPQRRRWKFVLAGLTCAMLLVSSGCQSHMTPRFAHVSALHHHRRPLELSPAAFQYANEPAFTPGARWKDQYLRVRAQGVRTKERVVAITFDDGPTAETTRIVNALASEDDHATFFCIGARIDTAPALYVVTHGDELANHSWDHPHFRYLTSTEASEEIGLASQRVAAITGVPPVWFRSPFDQVWPAEIAEIERHGLLYADFDVNTHDWRPYVSDADVLTQVHDELRPGGVIVMHDGIPHSTAILPRVLAYIKSRGYAVVTLSNLAQLGPPIGPALTPDSNPRGDVNLGRL